MTELEARDAGEERRISGRHGAPLIVVYADFSCPDCALAMRRLAPLDVRIDLRHFVLRARGVPARRAALAAEAAALQGAFWPFAKALLAEPGRQELPDLWALAERLGLDVERFDADRRSEPGAARIAAETREALEAGAAHVPAILASREAVPLLAAGGVPGAVLELPAS